MKLTLLKGTSEASDLLQRQDPLDMDAISSTVIQGQKKCLEQVYLLRSLL